MKGEVGKSWVSDQSHSASKMSSKNKIHDDCGDDDVAFQMKTGKEEKRGKEETPAMRHLEGGEMDLRIRRWESR